MFHPPIRRQADRPCRRRNPRPTYPAARGRNAEEGPVASELARAHGARQVDGHFGLAL
jgi:hypothetical protein